jgi:hypothetical protein
MNWIELELQKKKTIEKWSNCGFTSTYNYKSEKQILRENRVAKLKKLSKINDNL